MRSHKSAGGVSSATACAAARLDASGLSGPLNAVCGALVGGFEVWAVCAATVAGACGTCAVPCVPDGAGSSRGANDPVPAQPVSNSATDSQARYNQRVSKVIPYLE